MAWFQSRWRSKWLFNQRMNFTVRWVSRSMTCSMMPDCWWFEHDLADGTGGRLLALRLSSAWLTIPLRLRI